MYYVHIINDDTGRHDFTYWSTKKKADRYYFNSMFNFLKEGLPSFNEHSIYSTLDLERCVSQFFSGEDVTVEFFIGEVKVDQTPYLFLK